MAITQSKRQSDLEKRLHLLKQQVYGKANIATLQPSPTSSITSTSNARQLQTDLGFLRTDLIKISLFAVIIFGIQFVLFYLVQNKIINF